MAIEHMVYFISYFQSGLNRYETASNQLLKWKKIPWPVSPATSLPSRGRWTSQVFEVEPKILCFFCDHSWLKSFTGWGPYQYIR